MRKHTFLYASYKSDRISSARRRLPRIKRIETATPNAILHSARKSNRSSKIRNKRNPDPKSNSNSAGKGQLAILDFRFSALSIVRTCASLVMLSPNALAFPISHRNLIIEIV